MPDTKFLRLKKENLSELTINEAMELFKKKRRYLGFLASSYKLNANINTINDLLNKLIDKFSYEELNAINVLTLKRNCNCKKKSKAPSTFSPFCPVGVDVCHFVKTFERICKLVKNKKYNKYGNDIDDVLLKVRDGSSVFDSKFIEEVDILMHQAHLDIIKANPIYVATASVCPSELFCQNACPSLNDKPEIPVNFGCLESFIAGWVSRNSKRITGYSWCKHNPISEKRGEKIAIIGSGPAGLAAAYDLATYGYKVSVFESFSSPGGILIHGIPEYRLPKYRVRYVIKMLENMGVVFKLNNTIKEIAKDKSCNYYKINGSNFNAYLIAVGRGEPCYPGNNTNYKNVVFDTEFLKEINLYIDYHVRDVEFFLQRSANIEELIINVYNKIVVVVGSGNSTLDVARTLLRLHAKKVYVLSYANNKLTNRFDKPPTTIKRDVDSAIEDGVEIVYGSSFVNLFCEKETDDFVSGVRFLKKGKTCELQVDFVIYSLGRNLSKLYNLDVLINDYGQIINREDIKSGQIAAGDCTTKYFEKENPYKADIDNSHHYNNVITAILSGRNVAKYIDDRIKRYGKI